MRVLLVSTYDLGRQPFGLASPAAWLARAGASVRTLDLAVESFDEERVRWAELIAFHVPMHSATRAAVRLVPRVRAVHPAARLCFYGLYAPMNADLLRDLGAVALLGGEFEPGLVALVERLSRGGSLPDAEATVSLERLSFLPPERGALPPLDRYAALVEPSGARRVVGSTEASRGCRHRCRHCPLVPVYDGRFRIVQRGVVLEDIRRQVAAGARHITFGDPDFFNGVGHAIPLVRALHAEHPGLTYDVTIKIEHLKRHARHLGTLRDTGCLFVTSAVESVDDAVLARLEKHHTRADFIEVTGLMRREGLALSPTFVAFHPWLTLEGYLDLLGTIDALDLVESVAPVQLAIRLLIPAGSRLLELEEVRALAGPFDREALVHPWRHPDERVDALQRTLETTIAEAAARGDDRRAIFERVWTLAAAAAGGPADRTGPAGATLPRRPVPHLTEPWYC